MIKLILLTRKAKMIKMLKNPLTQEQWRKLVNKAIGSMTMGGLTLDDISDFDISLYYSDSLNPTELIESANCCAEDAMNNDNPNFSEYCL